MWVFVPQTSLKKRAPAVAAWIGRCTLTVDFKAKLRKRLIVRKMYEQNFNQFMMTNKGTS